MFYNLSNFYIFQAFRAFQAFWAFYVFQAFRTFRLFSLKKFWDFQKLLTFARAHSLKCFKLFCSWLIESRRFGRLICKFGARWLLTHEFYNSIPAVMKLIGHNNSAKKKQGHLGSILTFLILVHNIIWCEQCNTSALCKKLITVFCQFLQNLVFDFWERIIWRHFQCLD